MRQMRQIRAWALLATLVAIVAMGGMGCTRQSKIQRHLARAGSYFESKQTEKARIEYLNALRLGSTNALAYRRLGEIFMDQGNWQGAYAALSKAKQLAPADLDVRMRLATIYFAVRELKRARDEILPVLDKDPGRTDAVLMLADLAQTPEEARDTLLRIQELRQKAGERPVFPLAAGALYLRSGSLKAAEAALQQAVALDPKSSAVHSAFANLYARQTNAYMLGRSLKAAADLAPPKSNARLRYADFKLRSGGSAEARAYLKELLAQAPDFHAARVMEAQIAFDEGRYADCIAGLDSTIALEPRHYEALLLRSKTRIAQGEMAKAIADLERMIKLFPRTPEPRYQLGLAHLRNRDPERAVGSLREVLVLTTNNFPEATLALAQIDLAKGETAPATLALIQLARKYPTNLQARMVLASAYRAQNRLDDALAEYKKVSEAAPNDAQPLFQAGLVLRQQGRTAEARRLFEQMSAGTSNALPLVTQLVELDLQEKKLDSALQRAAGLAQREPKAAGAQFLLAQVHLARKDRAAAEAVLAKTVELDPGAREACLLLAQIYTDQRNFPQAVARLNALLAQRPNDAGAWAFMGMVQNAAGDYAKARDAYEKALESDPKSGLALNNLAFLYSEQFKQPDKAYEMARRAREASPKDPAVADTLGWIAVQRGDAPWALNLLQEAARGLPRVAEVQFHLGEACYLLGQEGAAREAFDRALKLDAGFRKREEVQRRLAVLNLDPASADAQADADLERLVRERPGDAIAALRLGARLERKGQFDAARAAYEGALVKNPKAANLLVRLAQLQAERLNNPAAALELAKRARNLLPEDPQVGATLGRLAYQAHDFEWAHSLLQDAAHKLTNDAAVQYAFGSAAYAVGRTADAVAATQLALAINPAFPQAEPARRLLEWMALAGQPSAWAAAEPRLQQALKAASDSVPVLMVWAGLQEQRGQTAEAALSLERVLSQFPVFVPATKALARIYADQPGQEAKAYELAVKARAALPNDADVARTLGKAAYRKKDYTYAARLLQESLRALPGDADALYFLGLSQGQLKQKNESKQSLTKALALNANHPMASEAKRLLGELK